MEWTSAQGSGPEVQVLGVGHFAAAVRLELIQQGLRNGLRPRPGAKPIVLACSDFDNPASFKEMSRLAHESGSALLYLCLASTAEPPQPRARASAARLVRRLLVWLAQGQ